MWQFDATRALELKHFSALFLNSFQNDFISVKSDTKFLKSACGLNSFYSSVMRHES